ISGTNVVWAQKSATVSGSGSHTLKWAYSKDGSVSRGNDCGWVDQVSWSASSTPIATSTNKYALCVGINQYSLSGCSTLSGCVNDALYFHANLKTRGGWPTANMTKLTDSGATKTAIRNAITGYASRAAAGDTFVYMHSSHGGQNSGTSTYLCAYDDCYEDTELATDLARFPTGVKVVVVVDACHSGGLFKGDGTGKAPVFGLAERVSAIMDDNRAKSLARGEKGVLDKLSASEIGWVTAADYDESSYDGGSYETGDVGAEFLSAFTEGWSNGRADTTGVGDRDGYLDGYEGWKYGYDACSNLQSPQYYNVDALRRVELGTCGGTATLTCDLRTAVDNTSLSFTTGGSASWIGQKVVSHDGVDAARSGVVSSNQTTWMQTTVTGPGTVSFWWNVSSESGYDKLTFLVDGSEVASISGTNVVWAQKSATVSGSGSHTLKWAYSKDGSVSRGNDCGWVDQIVWTASRTVPSKEAEPAGSVAATDGTEAAIDAIAIEAESAPVVLAVTASDGGDAGAVADGDEETAWTPDAPDGAWVVLTLSDEVDVGDIEVVGDHLPEGIRFLLSEDAEEWREEVPGRAQYVWVVFPAGDEALAVKEIRVLAE
ncbi:MAG: caspase family protein, partial [Kiritimatiellae bacterium]|nr:caspase family protein [Kiritimatiellia bacterium]